MLKSIVAVSAGLVGCAHAFWRMECPGRIGLARMDPIVNTGGLSPHLHAIHGSSGTLSHIFYCQLVLRIAIISPCEGSVVFARV